MEILDFVLKLALAALAIKSFLMAKFIHPETTDRAGERYTDEDLKNYAKRAESMAHCKERRNMFIIGGVLSLVGLVYLVWR